MDVLLMFAAAIGACIVIGLVLGALNYGVEATLEKMYARFPAFTVIAGMVILVVVVIVAFIDVLRQ